MRKKDGYSYKKEKREEKIQNIYVYIFVYNNNIVEYKKYVCTFIIFICYIITKIYRQEKKIVTRVYSKE